VAADGKHELVEYGDFECPYCLNAYPELKELRRRCGDKLVFVWRHFPLEKHPHALLAAQAAEAAGAQGRFWEMHDLLFENQRHLDLDDLVGYAERLGLDTARFRREIEDGTHLDRINVDIDVALEQHVAGTPTLFIDGEPYLGFYDAEALSDEIRARG
jgi:protein-disulfide isomerase